MIKVNKLILITRIVKSVLRAVYTISKFENVKLDEEMLHFKG